MTNLPVTGEFRVTCPYHKKGSTWIAGWHTGVDIVNDSRVVYSTCDGQVFRVVWGNKDYGNYVVIKDDENNYHYFCHLERIDVSTPQRVTRTTKIGIMGATGKASGIHLHYEIRKPSNRYNDTIDPTVYMGIPNEVGRYNSANYQIQEPSKQVEPVLKTLARNTNLRNEPTIHSSEATLYLANTTLYVLEESIAHNDGYTWDKVKIRVNNKEGYMINKNYK